MLLRIQRAGGHGKEHCESEYFESVRAELRAAVTRETERERTTSVTRARVERRKRKENSAAESLWATKNALGVSPRVPCIVQQRVTRVPAPKINGSVRFVSPSSSSSSTGKGLSSPSGATRSYRAGTLWLGRPWHAVHLDLSSQSAVWCLRTPPPHGRHTRVVPRATGPPDSATSRSRACCPERRKKRNASPFVRIDISQRVHREHTLARPALHQGRRDGHAPLDSRF